PKVGAARTGGGHRKPARVRLPAPRLDELAGLVNELTFAGASATPEQARRAGTQAASYVGELRARRSWWRRVRWSVDPRPLRWARESATPDATRRSVDARRDGGARRDGDARRDGGAGRDGKVRGG
ncbi:MAG TPA: hypothetical protein VHA75_14685, partial [Rugosimonospora sp.]|nr:hypothetical protein [Rugosimonospora sp.]